MSAASNSEIRSKKRFKFEKPLTASFGSAAVELIDISATGAQLRHNEPITVGKEATLSVPGGDFALKARVRWSRLGKGEQGAMQYRSGLTITEQRSEEVVNLVDQLVTARSARFDPESLTKKQEALDRKKAARVPVQEEAKSAAEQLEQVRRARSYLRNNPSESTRWLNRARFGLSRSQSTRPLEELAVWEFLDRKVDLKVVDLAFKLVK